MGFSVSMVIQTHNECLELRCLLDTINQQKHVKTPEIIVVDHGSEDDTSRFAQERGCRFIPIGDQQMEETNAMNLGAEAAHGEILVFTVGHAMPLRDDWLKCGTEHFRAPLVGGVFAPALPDANAGLADCLYCWPMYAIAKLRQAHRVDSPTIARFATANLAIRRFHWKEHPFSVGFGLETQMTEWISWMMSRGFDFFEDVRFAVRYTLGLNWMDLKQQILMQAQANRVHLRLS